jgi:hypothetical protein
MYTILLYVTTMKINQAAPGDIPFIGYLLIDKNGRLGWGLLTHETNAKASSLAAPFTVLAYPYKNQPIVHTLRKSYRLRLNQAYLVIRNYHQATHNLIHRNWG